MKKKLFFSSILIVLFNALICQTLYVPSGVNGIGTSANSNVGVGVSSPNAKLDVNGSFMISGSNHCTFGHANGHGVINFGNNGLGQLNFRSLLTAGNINSFNQLMVLTYDGKLGIGTTNPGNHKLAVNGSIRAKSVFVETGWSDFVFEPNYKLMSLSEVEAFIKTHKHLPDIPSEAEIVKYGVSLGEIQSKLLQKIEELTLYIIKLDIEIKELNTKIENLYRASKF